MSGEYNLVKTPELTSLQKDIENAVKDPSKRTNIIRKMTAIYKSHSGPLPPPEFLKEYEEILSGLAERIVKMAENQSEHRIKIEKEVVHAQLHDSKMGQIYGFIIGLGGLTASCIMALYGHDEVAKIVGGSTLAALVTVFVLGKRSQKRELESKE